MSDEKYTEDDPERTLITLNQLSQTIEVMTTVVNRLRQHLSEKLKAQSAEQVAESAGSDNAVASDEIKVSEKTAGKVVPKRESFVVEIKQQETDPEHKATRVLH